MKPSELRRELKMRYHDWKSTQHGAIENVSGDESIKQETKVHLIQLINQELAQLQEFAAAISALEEHLKSQLKELP
jgi:DNA-directed RNA polymerase sigma subunit (sigma70/sigma32)